MTAREIGKEKEKEIDRERERERERERKRERGREGEKDFSGRGRTERNPLILCDPHSVTGLGQQLVII